jgi:hypothetical protein
VPLISRIDNLLFIEFVICGKSECVAGFNPYCVRVIEEKIKYAGHWLHLQINNFENSVYY